MRALPAGAQAALDARAVTIRDFLWIEARNNATQAIVPVGFWSDLGDVTAQVIDPRTGIEVARSFEGAGGMIDISQVPMTSNLTVQTVDITLSQISNANDLIRGYDLKQARVEIFRGLFAPASLVQLAPAYARFVGFIDMPDITTPAEGEAGDIKLTCAGHSQEMSRANTATRSDADQRKRAPADAFSRHAAAVGTWELQWGNAT